MIEIHIYDTTNYLLKKYNHLCKETYSSTKPPVLRHLKDKTYSSCSPILLFYLYGLNTKKPPVVSLIHRKFPYGFKIYNTTPHALN